MLNRSLQKQLVFILTGSFAILWLIVTAFVYRDSHAELDRIFDSQLAQSAKLLYLQASHEAEELEEWEEDFPVPVGHEYERQIAFQIYDDYGLLILKSKSAPDSPLGELPSGFEDRDSWRVFSLTDERSGLTIRAAQKHEIREKLAEEIAMRLLWPLLFALPMTAGLAWVITQLSLLSLTRLAREVSKRDSKDLNPIDAAQAPLEVQPLINGLNLLLQRVEKTLIFERRFTSDAAHELKTPLAGIRLQAELAETATGEARSTALKNLISSVDRLTRILNQLLLMARLEGSNKGTIFAPVDLAKLSRQVLSDLSERAIDQKIEISFEGPDARIRGSSELLEVLLRNLVENALRHTPQKGEVRVRVESGGAEIRLAVEDSGPGVSADQYEKIFDSFYRGPMPKGEGSGLGLSIVKRIAEIHDASVLAGRSEKLGGLKVALSFKAET